MIRPSTSCHTLIHLVSDQTMQNILPILALKPSKVIQIVSDTSNSRFMEAARRTRDTVKLAAHTIPDFRFDCEWPRPLDLGAQTPSVEATKAAVNECLRENSEAIVNYTGGTKNMSIGAWVAAKELGKPVVYCDTPNSFIFDGYPELGINIPSLKAVADFLTVPVILSSQGLERNTDWISKNVNTKQKSLGQVAFELIEKHGSRFRNYRNTLGNHGEPPNGKIDARRIDFVASNPIPRPPDESFFQFLESACAAGLLREQAGEYYYHVSNLPHGHSKNIKNRIQAIAQGLTGAAFEGYVAHVLGGSRRFSSFLANVYPSGSSPEESGFGESDFLAYDSAKISLTLISCKASPPKLEHLESLLARKAKFGGLFASTLICVESGVDKQREATLRAYCKSLGIECAVGTEIPRVLAAGETQTALELLQAAFAEPVDDGV